MSARYRMLHPRVTTHLRFNVPDGWTGCESRPQATREDPLPFANPDGGYGIIVYPTPLDPAVARQYSLALAEEEPAS